jgi:MHS family shikimate/dehydroshikimate transporter-like MFS transporter
MSRIGAAKMANDSTTLRDAVGNNPAQRRVGKVAAATTIGTAVEWYDYFIFGTAAALVFPTLFFAESSVQTGLQKGFAAFAIGFLARPLGAAIFGHFGDRLGRKPMMIWTMGLMGGATFLIGVLPTHASIGNLAPILLIVLRMVQGIGVGGEWGAAALMAIETGPKQRKGLFGSLPAIGAPLGVLMSTGIFTLLAKLLSPEALLNWGWRIPFLLSAVLIAIAFWVRTSIEESPEFVTSRAQPTVPRRNPLLQVLSRHPALVLAATGAYIATAAAFYTVTVWFVGYATAPTNPHPLTPSSALNAVLVFAAVSTVCMLLFGTLSDRIGRRPTMLAGSMVTAVVSIPLFWLFSQGSMGLNILAMVCWAVVLTPVAGTVASFFAELFPTEVRYSGTSMSFQLASVLGGGLTPNIATKLVGESGSIYSVAVYVAVLALLAAGCVALAQMLARRSVAGAPRVALASAED